MVEFYSIARATNSCGPLYVGQQQRALQHRQDIIYRPSTGIARHTTASGDEMWMWGRSEDRGRNYLGAISEDREVWIPSIVE